MTYTKKQLQEIFRKHKLWLRNKSEGQRADLRRADLREADLQWANLQGADLQWANLREANLQGADLQWANLREANLRRADLRRADLREADLRRADLRRADLQLANLQWANLQKADLRRADLRRADLQKADLQGADLRRADLQGADLQGAENIPNHVYYSTIIFPKEGSFIGWKKCRDNIIVKLLILEDSLRSNATGRKCRASKVKVLEIFGASIARSQWNSNFFYNKDQIIEIEDFDKNRWRECSTGIHFFITRKEAEEFFL